MNRWNTISPFLFPESCLERAAIVQVHLKRSLQASSLTETPSIWSFILKHSLQKNTAVPQRFVTLHSSARRSSQWCTNTTRNPLSYIWAKAELCNFSLTCWNVVSCPSSECRELFWVLYELISLKCVSTVALWCFQNIAVCLTSPT